jgi:hypothetical protein
VAEDAGAGRDAAADALLRRAAERAAGRPFFLAAALLPYARAEGLNYAALAERLGCAPAVLPRLLLCRRPRPEPGAFRADLEQLGATFGLDVGRLAAMVRLADARAALQAAQLEPGLLAAARDREPEERTPGDTAAGRNNEGPGG